MWRLRPVVRLMHPNERLLRDEYRARADRDDRSLADVFADDIVWHVPGKNAIAGEYRGKAEQAWGEARDKAEHALGDARDRVRTFQEDAEQYVRENPTRAVLTALGIGFVLGLIFRR